MGLARKVQRRRRKRETFLADQYFTRGHRFQPALGERSSQDVFLIKQRVFLSSFELFLWQCRISGGNSACGLQDLTDWLIRAWLEITQLIRAFYGFHFALSSGPAAGKVLSCKSCRGNGFSGGFFVKHQLGVDTGCT